MKINKQRNQVMTLKGSFISKDLFIRGRSVKYQRVLANSIEGKGFISRYFLNTRHRQVTSFQSFAYIQGVLCIHLSTAAMKEQLVTL